MEEDSALKVIAEEVFRSTANNSCDSMSNIKLILFFFFLNIPVQCIPNEQSVTVQEYDLPCVVIGKYLMMTKK